ncbi:hypothetical protein VTL71DRAFT_5206 [Oculimacula yallundae]|uniref:Uncharacterized protein n=1 Tax=Oculimacula yallundae TaxID=86028 RepID=A0ABR4C0F8_9HELO
MANSLPSSYALKYGIHPGAPFGPGKSGLTPVAPSFGVAQPSIQTLRDLTENYQRRVLNGYTSRELEELDCLTNRQLHPNDLTNHILPIFQQSNWSQASSQPYPELDESTLGADIHGKPRIGKIPWNGSDPRIWMHLEPCVKLACQILCRVHSLPWFDALITENYESIPPNRFQPEDILASSMADLQRQFKKFRPRTQNERARGPDSREKLRTLISEVLLPKLKLGFMSDGVNPNTGPSVSPSEATFYGVTLLSNNSDICIYLSCDLLTPLMRQDLTSSERLLQTFQVAVTLVHEFMVSCLPVSEYSCLTTIAHATHMAVSYFERGRFKGTYPHDFEPYYQQEQQNELGFSFEQALFGHIMDPMSREALPIDVRNTTPEIAVFTASFPHERTALYSRSPILINPSITDPLFLSPLPVTFYENLNSDVFWNVHVRAMGLKAIQSPKAISTLYFKIGTGGLPLTGDYTRTVEARETMRLAGMTPRERAEHAKLMRKDFVATYQPLTVERDQKVYKIRNQADIIHLTSTANPMIQSIGSEFLVMIEELSDIHKRICGMLSTMETELGGDLLDTRRSISSFHLEFIQFVVGYFPCPFVEWQLRLEKVVSDLDRLLPRPSSTMSRQQQVGAILPVPSLPQTFHPAGDNFNKSAQLAIPDIDMVSPTSHLPPISLAPPLPDYDAMIERAVNSINDKDTLKSLCEQILGSLTVEFYIRAVARVLMTSTGTMPAQQRLDEIAIGLQTLNSIAQKDRNCFRRPLKFEDILKLVNDLQTEAEELLRAQQATTTISGH